MTTDALVTPKRIPDEVVLSPDFMEKLKELVTIMRPFVHWCVVDDAYQCLRFNQSN